MVKKRKSLITIAIILVIAAIPLLFIFLGLLFPDQQKGMTIMSAGGAGQSAIK
ncbi:MAG: hypothetical protein HOG34_13795 [Bacteroidetes bacterium]|nr:hypothetical protein [Bacteroidota bacterium]